MIFALLKNNVVINTIVADQAFVDSHKAFLGYDVAIAFNDNDNTHPSPGATYDGFKFTAPPPEKIADPIGDLAAVVSSLADQVTQINSAVTNIQDSVAVLQQQQTTPPISPSPV